MDPDAVIAEEDRYDAEQAALAAAQRPVRRPAGPFGQFGFGAGPSRPRPARRPSGGFFGGLKFPFLF